MTTPTLADKFRALVAAQDAVDVARNTLTYEERCQADFDIFDEDLRRVRAWLAGYDYAKAEELRVAGEVRTGIVFSDNSIWAGVSDQATDAYSFGTDESGARRVRLLVTVEE